jgi:RimJ/RimL family protein N-acetyltransferase
VTRLRWIELPDHPAVVALLRAGYPDDAWSEAHLAAFLPKPGNVGKVLVNDHDLITAVVFYTLSRAECRFRRLVVAARRRGIGTTALALAMALLRNRGRFTARVVEDNWVAAAFLKARGFAFDPAAPRAKNDDGRDYYVFTKEKACQPTKT